MKLCFKCSCFYQYRLCNMRNNSLGFVLVSRSLLISVISLVFGYVVAFILKKTVGIRVSEQEEHEGLDIHEHRMSSYSNFTISLTQKSDL